MLALKIIDVKEFMNQLLLGSTFDQFELVEADITTFNTFSIDGKIRRDFYDSDTCDILDQNRISYSSWKETKPYCYSVIRGKRTPLYFKIIFQLPYRQLQSIFRNQSAPFSPELISGMFLNLQYKNKELLCTTGISLTAFVPDKTAEHQWDRMMLDFLQRHNIIYEKL
ncbi:MAG: DUF5721 family protein [Blautia sp.]|nr:DUF5721 family protein [Blautia sp.]MDY3999328.1 DUF5721 family protein [Blautia sp.]